LNVNLTARIRANRWPESRIYTNGWPDLHYHPLHSVFRRGGSLDGVFLGGRGVPPVCFRIPAPDTPVYFSMLPPVSSFGCWWSPSPPVHVSSPLPSPAEVAAATGRAAAGGAPHPRDSPARRACVDRRLCGRHSDGGGALRARQRSPPPATPQRPSSAVACATAPAVSALWEQNRDKTGIAIAGSSALGRGKTRIKPGSAGL